MIKIEKLIQDAINDLQNSIGHIPDNPYILASTIGAIAERLEWLLIAIEAGKESDE